MFRQADFFGLILISRRLLEPLRTAFFRSDARGKEGIGVSPAPASATTGRKLGVSQKDFGSSCDVERGATTMESLHSPLCEDP